MILQTLDELEKEKRRATEIGAPGSYSVLGWAPLTDEQKARGAEMLARMIAEDEQLQRQQAQQP